MPAPNTIVGEIQAPADLTDTHKAAVTAYWSLAITPKSSQQPFAYLVSEICEQHSVTRAELRDVVRKTIYYPGHAPFMCEDCKIPLPPKSRADYTDRNRPCIEGVCHDCQAERINARQEASLTALRMHFNYIRGPQVPIEELSFLECLTVYGLATTHNKAISFIGSEADRLRVTDDPRLDEQTRLSLREKGYIFQVKPVPSEILSAAVFLRDTRAISQAGELTRSIFFCGNQFRSGWYINFLTQDSDLAASCAKNSPAPEEWFSMIRDRLLNEPRSLEEIQLIQGSIRRIQAARIEYAASKICKEYRFVLSDERRFFSLIEHLAYDFAPARLNETLKWAADKTSGEIRSSGSSEFAGGHMFINNVRSYADYAKKSIAIRMSRERRLDSGAPISPLKEIISSIWLNGFSDWDSLSAREIVQIWVENANLA